MDDKNQKDPQELYKVTIKENPELFKSIELYDEAFKQVVHASREDAIGKIRRLVEGAFYLGKEVSALEKKLEEAKNKLNKKNAILEQVKNGDLGVLFKKDGGEDN